MARRGGRQKRFRRSISGNVSHLCDDGLGEVVPTDAQDSPRVRPLRVYGALPGESVDVTLHERRGSFDVALLDRSDGVHPQRVQNPCEHFLDCSGCVLQHLDPSAQVEHKFQVFKTLLERHEVEVEQWAEPIIGPTLEYRRKARLGVRWVEKKGRALVGFRELRDGRFIADNRSCPILAKPFSQLLSPLGDLLSSLSIVAKIPQIEIAAGDESAGMVVRVLEAPSEADIAALRTFAQTHALHVWIQPGGLSTIADLDGNLLSLDDPPFNYRIDDERLTLGFGPAQFIQVNRAVNEKMIARALEWLNPQADDRIVDLFCGLGNFTLPLAARSHEVLGLEGDSQLVELARDNARRNGITDVRFELCDLYDQAVDLGQALATCNKVLLDPPRSGAETVVRALADAAVRSIVYVACGPEAMARDLAILGRAGFSVKCAGIMDMFPHTSHFESIAWLERDSVSE